MNRKKKIRIIFRLTILLAVANFYGYIGALMLERLLK